MYLILLLLLGLWLYQKQQQAKPRGSAAAGSGGWHSPQQTATLGGVNIDGNMFDNGTTRPIFNSQWSGTDPGVGNVVFAIQGGEDGQNPAQPVMAVSGTPVTSLRRFSLVGGSDPTKVPTVPVQVNTINDVVRRG